MTNDSSPKNTQPQDGWLREEYPDLFYVLRALDGEAEALRWLELKSETLCLFARALGGDRKSLKALQSGQAGEPEDLFVLVANADLEAALRQRHPELYELFEAIKGDDAILRRLKRKRAVFGRVAEVVRELYGSYPGELAAEGENGGAEDADTGGIPNGAAADVGCLIGEMHLRKGDYVKAVEAFTRSLASDATPDAYEGRARAYHALAQEDERRAEELREKP